MRATRGVVRCCSLMASLVVMSRAAAQSPPTGYITPNWGTYASGHQLQIFVEFQSYGSCFDAYAVVLHNGSAIGSTVPGAGCDYQSGTFTITMQSGTNTVTAQASDVYGTAQAEATFNGEDPPPPPALAPIVTPDADARLIPVTVGAVLPFSIKNPDSLTQAYTLTVTCAGVVSNCATAGELSLSAGETRDVWVSFNVNAYEEFPGPGWRGVRLRATAQSSPQPFDTGYVAVSLAPSGVVIERSACLTIAAGPGSAFECGDLRLVHALPTVRTLNRPRTPVLYYNSQHARPSPIVTADVTLPVGAPVPATVRAILWINGTKRDSTDWPGSAWGAAGQSRRVGQRWNAPDTVSTRVYDYRLELIRIGPGSDSLPSVVGQLAVVNRRASPFGPGWWLAGFERLHFYYAGPDPHVLWVGGDGSVRQYKKLGFVGQDTFYVAPPFDRPDTLWRFGSQWVRRLAGGGQVTFNSAGVHVSTTDRLGYVTSFVDSTAAPGLLARIELAPTAAGLSYRFSYAGSPARLSTVSAPDTAVGMWRVTSLVWAGDTLKVTDPGASAPVRFRYDPAGTQRILSRTDRRGSVSTFAYDAGHRLASSSRTLGGGETAALSFCAAEVRGLASCSSTLVAPESAYTIFDGPRVPPDSVDVMHFWVDAFGAPWKIRDPYSFVTVLARTDPSWPALVTRVQYPNGRITGAQYDARGNPRAATDTSLYVAGQHATTRYQWDQKWDAITEVVLPTGELSRFLYDASNGNRLWQEDGRGPGSRITFGYYASGNGAGLLKTVTLPGGARDSVSYDERGNLVKSVSPVGDTTFSIADRIGRPRIVRTPVGQGLYRSDTTYYDQASRPFRTATFGPAMNGADAEQVTVRSFYNDEGGLDSLKRWSTPDPAGVDTITTRWRYDLGGRRVAEIAPDLAVDSTRYDPAGNAVAVVTRRSDVGAITMTYDRLNRLRQRAVPSVTYYGRFQGIATYATNAGAFHPYPWFPTSAPYECAVTIACYSDSTQWTFTIPGDSEVFTYGSMGELLTADNADAKVKRTYFNDGRVQTDTLRVRNWNGTTFGHVYGLTYTYDLGGRLISLRHPWQLAPRNPGVMDLAAYGYDPLTGLLLTVRDPLNNEFTFEYNMRNERIRVDRPGGITERLTYDLDGRLVADTTVQGSGWFRRATMEYADAQRVSIARNSVAPQDTVRAFYTGLGHLRHLIYELPAYNQNPPDTAHVFSGSRLALDPLGNVTFARDSSNLAGAFAGGTKIVTRVHTYQPSTGRLVYTQSDRVDSAAYDQAGNLVYSGKTPWFNPSIGQTLEDHANFYGADNRLRAAEMRTLKLSSESETNVWTMAFERYRYDALGRRILVRTWRACEVGNQLRPCSRSSISRTVWNGSAELYDVQAWGGLVGYDPDPTRTWDPPEAELENDTLPVYKTNMSGSVLQYDASPHYGRVGYTGVDLDQPLSAIRIHFTRAVYDNHQQGWHAKTWGPLGIAPHWNWRGHPEIGAFANGTLSNCYSSSFGTWCAQVPWRIRPFPFTQQPADTISGWWGGWLRDKEDGTGTLFRRNRYIDPATGRFTQEDPIGLAGGLNLYGFANGDPVNFSDPFGLCPICPALILVAKGMALGAAVFGGTRVAYNAATDRPLGDGVQGDVARGALVGGGVGVGGAALTTTTALTTTARVAGPAAGAAGALGSRAEAIANLRNLGPETVGMLRDFFKSGQLPQGLTPEALQTYRNVADHAVRAGVDKLGVQAQRIQMIDDALKKMQ